MNSLQNLINSTGYNTSDTREENLITSLHDLQQKLPQYTQEVIQGLMNIHRGPEEGRMETFGLSRTVTSDEVFQIDSKSRTIKLSNEMFPLDLEKEACNPFAIQVPPYLEFKAQWDVNIITSGEGNNILGDNGGLYFEQSFIQIPTVKATKETLAYYGALLIQEDSPIRFSSDEPYPLWKMHIGPNYVDDYIMTKEGGGFYLEFHHDQPHFHMVVDGGGYYLLAKQIGEHIYHITAFELTNGQAVYTKKGAIHCDAALTGDLVVGYTVSEECSTVLLRTKAEREMVKIEFV